MLVLGFLGSPRLTGICSKLLQKTLDGARSRGAEIKRYDLINCNIKFCRGCCTCFVNDPELPIGKCPLNDDMQTILEEYTRADGYVFASPVYDMFVSALMKRFLERKIMLTYRPKEDYGRIPGPRTPGHFTKKASLIVTGNASDEYETAMGEPCFDAWQAHLPIEQVDTVDQLYVGGVETISSEALSQKLTRAFHNGVHLVEEITKGYKADGPGEQQQMQVL